MAQLSLIGVSTPGSRQLACATVECDQTCDPTRLSGCETLMLTRETRIIRRKSINELGCLSVRHFQDLFFVHVVGGFCFIGRPEEDT